MNRTEKRKIIKKILKCEEIISNEKSLDKSVQKAQEEIEVIMSALSFEDIIEIDDYIMRKMADKE